MSEHSSTLTAEGERFESPPRALEYPQFPIPATGDATSIADGLGWLRVPLPIQLNHINLWLLDDEPGWTLVDTGMPDAVCRDAWEAIERQALRGRRIARIVITHDHPDHVGLASWLAERNGAEVWMSEYAHRTMSEYVNGDPVALRSRLGRYLRSHGMKLPDEFESQSQDTRRWFDQVPVLGRALADGETLRLGGADWCLIETWGHCGGHLCLHDPARKLLISGDQVLPQISSNVSVLPSRPESDPLREFLESLARVAASDPDTLVLPSHGKPFHGLRHRIDDLGRHHAQQLGVVRESCREPRSAVELLPAMFGRALRGPHAVMGLMEAVAHANHLMHRGELRRDTDDHGVHRFSVPGIP